MFGWQSDNAPAFRDMETVSHSMMVSLFVVTSVVAGLALSWLPVALPMFVIVFLSMLISVFLTGWMTWRSAQRAMRKREMLRGQYRDNREAETQKKIDEMRQSNSRLLKVQK